MPRNMIQELQWITVLHVSYIDDAANKHHINCKIQPKRTKSYPRDIGNTVLVRESNILYMLFMLTENT